MSARSAAINAIKAVDDGQQAQEALAAAANSLPSSERALCSDLVYGTLRARQRLDWLLRRLLPRPQALPRIALISLQIAAYSLLFQEKIPAYAAVNETVSVLKKHFGQKLANVGNGCLRALLRLGDKPYQISFYGKNATEAESRYYSIPTEIAELWRKAYGSETARNLMERSFKRPHGALRLNLHSKAAPALAEALKKECWNIGRAGFACPPGKLPATILGKDLTSWQQEGALSFQSAGSQEMLSQFGLYEHWQGVPVWDACTGIGGKSAALLEAGIDVALASDLSYKRLHLLPLECMRLNLPAPLIIQANAINPPLKSWQGNILVDAPCSGLGVVARRPDLKERWSLAKTNGLENLQARILARMASFLAPGRELCYLTCTLNPGENENQVNRLLRDNSDLELICQWHTPHDHPWLEGMFGARLKKLPG